MLVKSELLNLAFQKCGYDSAFLSNVRRNYYDGFLKDEEALVNELYTKYCNRSDKHLVIYPDHDVDGIFSWMDLLAGLSILGVNVSVFVPKVDRGYGFHLEDVEDILAQYSDVTGIITCDVGVTGFEACACAKLHGLDMYVTDHHNEVFLGDDKKRITEIADLVVDPCRLDEDYEFTSVCGAFVAFHIMQRLARKFDASKQDLVDKLKVFAMIGSLGDSMIMRHDTLNVCQDGIKMFRKLVKCVDGDFTPFFNEKQKHDIDSLPANYRLPFEGLYAYMLFLMSQQTVTSDTVFDFTFMHFTIIPRLNSPRRMGESIDIIYKCFCVDYDTFGEYVDSFTELETMNTRRKELVDKVMANIDTFRVTDYIYDITTLGIPAGLYGLIATKLIGIGLPFAFVGSRADGCINGSGRACGGLDGQLLRDGTICILGHDNAFGFSLRYEDIKGYQKHLEDLVDAIRVQSLGTGIASDPYDGLVHVGFGDADKLSYDYIYTDKSSDDCYNYAYDVQQLDCFDTGFEEPEFVLDFKKSDVDEIKIIGKKGTTLRIVFKNGLKIIFFNGADYLDMYEKSDKPKEILGTFGLNKFRGSYSLQFMAKGVF